MSSDESEGDEGGIIALNRKSQLFLQAAISRRFFSQRDAQAMHRRCCEILGDEPGNFPEFIEHIAKAIEPYGLSLKKRGAERDGKPWFALVNMKSDEATKVATELSPNEIQWFRQLIERIIHAPNMAYCVPRAAAFEIGKNLKPAISRTDAQALLASLVLKGWLHRDVERNIFSLSTRTLLELEAFLLEEFPEELEEAECGTCKELVFEGLQCPGQGCQARMHVECRRVTAAREPDCAACQTAWPAGAGRSIGIRALDAGPPDEDEDEDEDQVDVAPATGRKKSDRGRPQVNGHAKTKPTRTSARRKPAPTSEMTNGDDEDDDDDDEEVDELDEEIFEQTARDLDTQLTRMESSEA